MAEKQSSSLCNLLLNGTGLKTVVDTVFKLYIYAGPIPASANAGLSGNTLICTVAETSTHNPVSMAAAASDGVLTKNATVWDGVVSNAGALSATFYRFQKPADSARSAADAGGASTATPCVQGTIGPVTGSGYDMVVGAVALVDTTTFVVNYFSQSIVPS